MRRVVSEGRSLIRRVGPFVGVLILVVAVAIGVVAVVGGESEAEEGVPAFTGEELNAPAAENWITQGGSLSNQQYSTLDQIDTENVGELQEAWRVDLKSAVGDRFQGEAAPLVYDGVMYHVTGASDVFALDAATGEILWRYKANLPPPSELDTVCCGWDNRGLGLGDGKVFLQRLDGDVVALDAETGKVVWRVTNLSYEDGFAPTSAPRYYEGLVYVGSSGGEYLARGSVTAYQADTGRRAWRFYTVPQPGEIGGSTWTQGAGGLGYNAGGATVWNTPAIDPETNTLTFTTSNAAPWAGRGPGDNLFTSSFVALDTKTGQYRWHFQQVHHDIWDYDCPSPTVMFDMEVDGEMRHAVAEACKTGWVYVIDRDTGEPLLPIEEKKVPQNEEQNTAATQPYPVGDAFSNQCAQKSFFQGKKAPDGKPYRVGCIFDSLDDKQFVGVAPHALGGQNWHPTSYNPNTNYLYVCSKDTNVSYKVSKTGAFGEALPGQSFIGVEFGDGNIYRGRFVAMDMSDNTIAWENVSERPCYSGSFTTAGGLVFIGDINGDYKAYDAATGDELWSTELDTYANASGMSYEVDGEQYIAVYGGGSSFDDFKMGDKGTGSELYAFKLP